MFKLTKAQRKDRERIEAWLNGVPFRENSRAKPAIPALSPADVLAQYVPPSIQETGQYFTPPEMAQAAVDWAGLSLHDKDILEPCAGIGHLLAVCPDLARVTCYELEQECAALGKRLWPAADWHWAIPFDVSERLAGRFDVALCNPPFSTMRGMQPGFDMTGGRAARSEHCFLALAALALKPEGDALFFAPYNFWAKVPKALRAWLDKEHPLELVADLGELPGEFRFTSVRVHGFHLRSCAEAVIAAPAWPQAVNIELGS